MQISVLRPDHKIGARARSLGEHGQEAGAAAEHLAPREPPNLERRPAAGPARRGWGGKIHPAATSAERLECFAKGGHDVVLIGTSNSRAERQTQRPVGDVGCDGKSLWS